MKKLLIASLVLAMAGAAAVYAADSQPSTYTERFIQKHTQKIVDKEKELQQQQKAREEAIEKQRQERLERQEALQKKIEADKKAREDAQKARQQKLEKKKQLWNELISD